MYFKGQLLKDTHEFPKTLIDSLQNGQVIPFVGAGVSRAIQNKDTGKPLFPNWKELLLKASLSLILGTEAHCISSGLPPGPRHLLEAALPIVLITVNAWLTVPAESPRLASPRMNRSSGKFVPFNCFCVISLNLLAILITQTQ